MATTTTAEPVALRIGGRAVAATRNRDVKSPYDGHVVGRVAVAGRAEFEAALAAAAAAAPLVGKMAAHARATALGKAAALLRERADAFAALIRDEGGKPTKYAKGEVERAIRTMAASAEEATRLH